MRYVHGIHFLMPYWHANTIKAVITRFSALFLCLTITACVNDASNDDLGTNANRDVTVSRSAFPSPDAKVLLTTLPEHRDVILFDVNSYDLTTQAQLILDPIAIRLRNYPDTYLVIVGHSDDDGSDEDNIVLSYERAFSVAIYITAVFGIEEERLQIIAAGKDEPVVTGKAILDKQQNRRVEVISPQAIVRTLSPIAGKK
ncbi:OmpA family protein [Photobacterium swingsii]|uniref:OmpA family protein n=1 Tax=Photobacterium swingsii TaxID=680026 RepID=UPI0040690FFD